MILKTNLETLTFPGDFYDSQNQMHVVKFLQFETDNSALFTTVITAAPDCRAITIGVPQGSILGPLLFNSCVNSLPNAVKIARVILYHPKHSVPFNGSLWLDDVSREIPEHLETFKITLHNTRNNYLPRIPSPKTEWGKRTTYYRYISTVAQKGQHAN